MAGAGGPLENFGLMLPVDSDCVPSPAPHTTPPVTTPASFQQTGGEGSLATLRAGRSAATPCARASRSPSASDRISMASRPGLTVRLRASRAAAFCLTA